MGQVLQLTQDLTAHRFSVVIYWRKRTGFDSLQNGHAALIIDTSAFTVASSEYYVSWQAEGGTGKNLGTKFRATQADFMEDAQEWGGQEVGADGYHMPTRWVILRALDTMMMKAAWDQMRGKQGAHWKLIDKNCATAVARILKAGGGDDYATKHSKQLIWWPTDLVKYARSMGDHVVRTS